ncbi:hypothetical protein LDENG_00077900 [Lucifuga dentata]|nr:hypothetical protein LDENG_00077900 [Lucifuga dentata]
MRRFSAAVTGKLVRTEGRINAVKYRKVLEESLLQSAMTPDLGDGSPFSTTT